jgi:hypothetical protein
MKKIMVGITSFLDERDRCNLDDTEIFFVYMSVRPFLGTDKELCLRSELTERAHRNVGSESELSSRKRASWLLFTTCCLPETFLHVGTAEARKTRARSYSAELLMFPVHGFGGENRKCKNAEVRG